MAGHCQMGVFATYFQTYYMMIAFYRVFKGRGYYLQFCCLSFALL